MVGIVTVDTGPLILDEPIAADKRVSGVPLTGARSALERPEASGFYAGTWGSEVGAWRVSYAEDELCVILEGRVRLTGDDGVVAEFGPGAAFVIPRGFSGVWETVEPVRKIYAVAT